MWLAAVACCSTPCTALTTGAPAFQASSCSNANEIGGTNVENHYRLAAFPSGSTFTLRQAQVGKAITVTASYTDVQGTAESKTSAATAAVTNVNDNPVTAVTDTNADTEVLAEDAAIGSLAGITAHASDADTGAVVTYSLSDNAGGRFAIDPTTGTVRLKASFPNQEKRLWPGQFANVELTLTVEPDALVGASLT